MKGREERGEIEGKKVNGKDGRGERRGERRGGE